MACIAQSPDNGMRPQHGQSLVETAIVVVFLTFLVMGIIEAGWAFMRTSMIEHSARDGARYGATLANATGFAYRDVNSGCFTGAGAAAIGVRVKNQLTTVGFTPIPDPPVVCQACDGPIPITKVRVQGTLSMIFGFLGSSYPIDRDVTFQDEQRTCPPAAGVAACPGC